MIAVREINILKNCEECKFCINQKTNDYGSFVTEKQGKLFRIKQRQ